VASYVVMQPPGSGASPDRAELVRDRFAWLGFLVPPLWLLWHRLWIEALLAVAASVTLTVLGDVARLGFLAAGLSLLVSLFVGLEGPALRLNALRRRGWLETGVIEAGSRDEAEIRYLEEESVAARQPPRVGVPVAAARKLGHGPALGLFDYPGR
jgi:hypothetical protein